MVPEGWLVCSLSDICKKQISYGIVQTGKNVENGVPCLRVVDLTKSELDPEEMIKTSKEISYSYSKTILEEKEIVVALRGEVGLARIIDSRLVGLNITRGLARISANENLVCPEFLLWELRSPRFRSDLMRRVGGSALQEISLSELRKVRAYIPPISEQKKIAQILSTWNRAITVTERLLLNSQKQKKVLMQQLLTGKKRLLDESGERFSGEWKRVELGDLLNYKQPTPYLVKSTEYDDSYEIPVLTAGKTFILGFTGEDFGVFSEDLPAIIFDDFTTDSKFVDFPFKAKSSAMKILTAKDGVSIKYVFEAMQLIDFAVGGHQRHWISIYSRLVIPFPSREEQQKIATVLSTADQEIKALEYKLNVLKHEKKALMQKLLTGKIRVNCVAQNTQETSEA